MCAYNVKSRSFYSNCFFEAIKAKILNFPHVKISFIPGRLNKEGMPHFYWTDKRTNLIYEFSSVEFEKHIGVYPLFFKGNIIESNKRRNETFLNMGIEKEIKAIEKRYGFISHITTRLEAQECNWFLYDQSLPIEEFKKGNKNDFVLGCGLKNGKRHIGIYYIDDSKGLLNPNDDNIEYFRFFNETLPI